ncbi:MAG TPA: hypothetical protein VEQ42_07995 [Pyrinomonadaceae bacterium]|nr:hypothetical protein [Pyrinomonadaceae bacterium]
MEEDNSLEFDLYENVRQNLTQVLVRSGRELIVAERIALYVVQGVRDVPKLISSLSRGNRPDAEVLLALMNLLEDASALNKAKELVLGLDNQKKLH